MSPPDAQRPPWRGGEGSNQATLTPYQSDGWIYIEAGRLADPLSRTRAALMLTFDDEGLSAEERLQFVRRHLRRIAGSIDEVLAEAEVNAA